jgi:hypothetical protein
MCRGGDEALALIVKSCTCLANSRPHQEDSKSPTNEVLPYFVSHGLDPVPIEPCLNEIVELQEGRSCRLGLGQSTPGFAWLFYTADCAEVKKLIVTRHVYQVKEHAVGMYTYVTNVQSM